MYIKSNMQFSVQQIAELLKGRVDGDKDVMISTMSKIEEGSEGSLTFLSNPKYINYVYTTKASAVLVDEDFVAERPISATLIRVPNAYQALATLLALVESLKPKKQGIQSGAIIADSSVLGEDVYVGHYAVIGENVKVGNNTKIYPHVVIDDDVEIGDDCIIYSNVSIYSGCKVSDRCIIHSGAVIGADGFGFAPDTDGRYNKIPQIGNVVLCDDVEVGANSTIDRATMGSTVISRGVKIDNLVQIAHNVEIGEDTVLAAQTGVAGSVKIGTRCVFAGQVGVAGHVTIADGTVFGAQTGVPSSIKEANKIWQGYPAMPVANFRKLSVLQKQLPDMARTLSKLEKKITNN